jgi:hypothetical protein
VPISKRKEKEGRRERQKETEVEDVGDDSLPSFSLSLPGVY